MHCAAKQQHKLTKALVHHLGGSLLSVRFTSRPPTPAILLTHLAQPPHASLLQYDELVATRRALALSPHDLRGRVMCKGKAKLATSGHDAERHQRSLSEQDSAHLLCLSRTDCGLRLLARSCKSQSSSSLCQDRQFRRVGAAH
eukprot:7386142-Prymnesium_polylepis.2